MATTTWTTLASTVAEGGFRINMFFHAEPDGTPYEEGDDTVLKTARIQVTLPMTGDSVVPQTQRTIIYRAAAASQPHDGVADGSSASTPAPITTGTAGDLQALQDVFSRLKKQARLDINGDVEA